MHHVVAVHRDPEQLRLLARWGEHEGLTVHPFETVRQALASLPTILPDVVVLDLDIVDQGPLGALARLQERIPGVPVITVAGEPEPGAEARRRGAYDHLVQPLQQARVVSALENALERRRLLLRVRELERALHGGFGGLIGESPPMKELYRELERGAPSEIAMLLIGEAGTGREHAARAIHEASTRRDGPFVALDLTAVPASRQASALFGQQRGSSEAVGGALEQAQGGTLLLHELGRLAPAVQAELFRALEQGRFYRVGGTSGLALDVRVVASTSEDLSEAVRNGSFLEPLHARLAACALRLPPLRERGPDVLRIARILLARQPNGEALGLHRDTEQALLAYGWPRNVVELDEVMTQAAAKARRNVRPADLPSRLVRALPNKGLRPVEERERHSMLAAIEWADGNIDRAAYQLDIPTASFRAKLRKYGIEV